MQLLNNPQNGLKIECFLISHNIKTVFVSIISQPEFKYLFLNQTALFNEQYTINRLYKIHLEHNNGLIKT